MLLTNQQKIPLEPHQNLRPHQRMLTTKASLLLRKNQRNKWKWSSSVAQVKIWPTRVRQAEACSRAPP